MRVTTVMRRSLLMSRETSSRVNGEANSIANTRGAAQLSVTFLWPHPMMPCAQSAQSGRDA